MPTTTTRLGMEVPFGGDLVHDGPADFTQAFGILDAAALFLVGTLAARPAAGTYGRYYLATDQKDGGDIGTLYVDDGSVWQLPNQVAFRADPLLSQPAAGTFGRVFYATDRSTYYFDNGTTWHQFLDLTQGVRASLPAAGKLGRVYMATDQNLLYFDNGNFWQGIGAIGVGTAAGIGTPSVNLYEHYWATNTGQLLFSTGSAWLPLTINQSVQAGGGIVPAGGYVTVTTGGTFTALPAVGSLPHGTLAGVRAAASITGASPVGVLSDSSIANIALPGNTSQVAGFSLGFPGSFWIGCWDANQASWRTVAGGADSGWSAITLPANTGFPAGTQTPASRLVNGVVTFQGEITLSNTIGSGVVGTVASAHRPSTSGLTALSTFAFSGGSVTPVYVDPSNGHITAATSLLNGTVVPIANCGYPLQLT